MVIREPEDHTADLFVIARALNRRWRDDNGQMFTSRLRAAFDAQAGVAAIDNGTMIKAIAGDHPIIVLTPASVPEIHAQTIQAFVLSERYRTPVVVLYDEVLGHLAKMRAAGKPALLIEYPKSDARKHTLRTLMPAVVLTR